MATLGPSQIPLAASRACRLLSPVKCTQLCSKYCSTLACTYMYAHSLIDVWLHSHYSQQGVIGEPYGEYLNLLAGKKGKS